MKTVGKGNSNLSKIIIKAISLFGGVQVLNIACSIIRTKLIAVWIGASGVGLFGLYNSAIEMITALTALGIRNSSVRDIAQESQNKHIIITVIRRWSWIVGLFGAIVTLALAPLLSQITFGDDTHIWGFVALACVLLLNALTSGEQAILQGSAMLRRLAQASIAGVIGSLIVSIPLFYYLRIDSIVPSIIAYSLVTAIATYVFRNKSYPKTHDVSLKETVDRGKGFIKLGIFMTISGFITLLFSYIFMAYLNNIAGSVEVGYYQAGNTLINKYAALIFTAMGMEYYPRLAKVNFSGIRLSAFVSQQIIISLLVLTPIITTMLLFRELIISLLYSADFLTIVPFISWALIGTIFRAISWCMAFVILAKGSGKIYIITETISTIIGFVLNVTFYHLWGLMGLGISFILWYFIYTIITIIVYFKIFKLSLNKNVYLYSIASLVISGTALFLILNNYLILSIIVCVVTILGAFIILRKLTIN